MAPISTHWKIDKTIPIALILAFLVQFGSLVWFAATTSSRVNQLEAAIAALLATNLPERLAKVEVRIENVESTVNRIEEKLNDR